MGVNFYLFIFVEICMHCLCCSDQTHIHNSCLCLTFSVLASVDLVPTSWITSCPVWNCMPITWRSWWRRGHRRTMRRNVKLKLCSIKSSHSKSHTYLSYLWFLNDFYSCLFLLFVLEALPTLDVILSFELILYNDLFKPIYASRMHLFN